MKAATLGMIAFAILALAAPRVASAGDDCCCHHCGCHDNLQKTCRLVCEQKEVKETKYSCKCEDFCIPGPSTRCGKECECDCTSIFGHTCKWIWQPSQCAKVHTKKVLVKEIVTKKVPSYKWVVDYKCGGCGNCGSIEKHVDASQVPVATAAAVSYTLAD